MFTYTIKVHIINFHAEMKRVYRSLYKVGPRYPPSEKFDENQFINNISDYYLSTGLLHTRKLGIKCIK